LTGLSSGLFDAWSSGSAHAQGAPDIDWVTGQQSGEARVHLYFFWSRSCPHCRKALPFVEGLAREYPWLALHTYELTSDRANVALYVEMARKLGHDARSVPAFLICGRMLTGYDNAEGMGAQVRGLAELCRPVASENGADAPKASTMRATTDSDHAPMQVPVLGEINARTLSLPLFTLLIAGLDAFNPCAFFVLLFLLSLMVHARSRARMLLVGVTFVFFSGLVYFLFMAAWLNLFLVIGGAPMVTWSAGLVALLIGALNVKDFFLFKQGPSLSIPEQAKPGLYRRMRGLLSAESLATMLFGTVALALAANSYELLCTAGFPMVYTRVLTLNGLTGWAHYGYLALYNLIYVLPLADHRAGVHLHAGRAQVERASGARVEAALGCDDAGAGADHADRARGPG
jgi:thiol-disulfide isomerase/thioredoxin